jgi:hypothetical protein
MFWFIRSKVEKNWISSEYSRKNHSGEMEKKGENGDNAFINGINPPFSNFSLSP